jgi:hypothetical protein
MILVGPIGHLDRSESGLAVNGETLEYKGFRLLARARRAPVGWIGELTILLPQEGSPLHVRIPIPRFYDDPMLAIRMACLEGIMRVDKGALFQF